MKNEAVLNLIKASLFHMSVSFPESMDWRAVYKEMAAQTILGLPNGYFNNHPIADVRLLTNWSLQVSRQTVLYYHLLEEQAALLELLIKNHISAVIIKGTAAAVAYPNPELRSFGDVDFLVKRSQFHDAYKLLRSSGYTLTEEYQESMHHAAFEKNGVSFELHIRVSGVERGKGSEYFCRLFEQGIEQAVRAELNGYEFFMLPRLQNGLTLLLHIKHHLLGGLGLRQIIDWMLFVDRNLSDKVWKEEFLPVLKRTQMDDFAKTVTRMCQLELGLRSDITWCSSADEKVCRNFLDYIMEMGNFGNKAVLEGGSKKVRRAASDGAVKGTGDVLRLLQRNGRINWKACRKYTFLRPFAWVYQGIQYMRIIGFLACVKRLLRAVKENFER